MSVQVSDVRSYERQHKNVMALQMWKENSQCLKINTST